MDPTESKSQILARILGFLPPSQLEKNNEALNHIAEDENFPNVDFNFEEIVDSSNQAFLSSPYTAHDEEDGIFR